MIVDEAIFHIEADIFIDMARGGMRFRAEDWPHFKHALEHPDHDLFVELRTLRQIRAAPEVFHREDVCAAFGSRLDQFGSLYFGEVLISQGLAETRHYA